MSFVSAISPPLSPIHYFWPWDSPREHEPPSHHVVGILHRLGPVGPSFELGSCEWGVYRITPAKQNSSPLGVYVAAIYDSIAFYQPMPKNAPLILIASNELLLDKSF